MTQVHCAALLFDMDGVLMNSTPAVARVWRQWAIEHGFDPEEVIARAHGRPSLTTVREYLPKPITKPRIAKSNAARSTISKVLSLCPAR